MSIYQRKGLILKKMKAKGIIGSGVPDKNMIVKNYIS